TLYGLFEVFCRQINICLRNHQSVQVPEIALLLLREGSFRFFSFIEPFLCAGEILFPQAKEGHQDHFVLIVQENEDKHEKQQENAVTYVSFYELPYSHPKKGNCQHKFINLIEHNAYFCKAAKVRKTIRNFFKLGFVRVKSLRIFARSFKKRS